MAMVCIINWGLWLLPQICEAPIPVVSVQASSHTLSHIRGIAAVTIRRMHAIRLTANVQQVIEQGNMYPACKPTPAWLWTSATKASCSQSTQAPFTETQSAQQNQAMLARVSGHHTQGEEEKEGCGILSQRSCQVFTS